MDHLFQLPADTGWGGPDEPMLESYSTLGFLAGVTSRIGLGALVGCAVFREPALLVKTATTVDVLSGGRLTFGIGAGWYEREALGLGLRGPSAASGSPAWRRPCASRTSCGPMTHHPSSAASRSWPSRSSAHSRWAARTRRS